MKQFAWLVLWAVISAENTTATRGAQVLWRGLQRLDTATEMYTIYP